jgi:hypothetical protein
VGHIKVFLLRVHSGQVAGNVFFSFENDLFDPGIGYYTPQISLEKCFFRLSRTQWSNFGGSLGHIEFLLLLVHSGQVAGNVSFFSKITFLTLELNTTPPKIGLENCFFRFSSTQCSGPFSQSQWSTGREQPKMGEHSGLLGRNSQKWALFCFCTKSRCFSAIIYYYLLCPLGPLK